MDPAPYRTAREANSYKPLLKRHISLRKSHIPDTWNTCWLLLSGLSRSNDPQAGRQQFMARQHGLLSLCTTFCSPMPREPPALNKKEMEALDPSGEI